MPERKLLRILGVLAAVSVLLTSAILVITYYEIIPSWRQIRGFLAAEPDRSTVSFSTQPAEPTRARETPRPSPQVAATPIPRPNPNTVTALEPRTEVMDYLIRRFVNRQGPAINVCGNLIDTPNVFPTGTTSFQQALLEKALGNVPENTYVEAALAPLAAVLERPAIGQFVANLQMARALEDARIIQGPDYRSIVALASSEAVAYRTAISLRAQHAYHLFVLSRASAIDQRLASSSDAQSICAREQTLATSDSAQRSAEINADKAALLRLLASAGLSPDQVGFDPNLQNGVTINVTSEGLTVSVPWVTKQFGTTFRLDRIEE